MKTEHKNFIKLELRLYNRNKLLLAELCPYELVVRKQLFLTAYIVDGIDNALAELPAEILAYAEIKYLKRNYFTNAGLALKFNVCERTIIRWDKQLLKIVARSIGLNR